MSAAVLLPKGVSERAGDVKVHVEDAGRSLRVEVAWPSARNYVNMLMEMWLAGDSVPKIEEYHPQIQGFFDFLEHFQKRQSDKIESFARIPLLFAVKHDFELHVLGWNPTVQTVLFVTLSASERNVAPNGDKIVVKSEALGNDFFHCDHRVEFLQNFRF